MGFASWRRADTLVSSFSAPLAVYLIFQRVMLTLSAGQQIVRKTRKGPEILEKCHDDVKDLMTSETVEAAYLNNCIS